jgi:hypothetical protein
MCVLSFDSSLALRSTALRMASFRVVMLSWKGRIQQIVPIKIHKSTTYMSFLKLGIFLKNGIHLLIKFPLLTLAHRDILLGARDSGINPLFDLRIN